MPGTPGPVQRPERPKRLAAGGCTFAEDPRRPAPLARVIWSAAWDPATLTVAVAPGHGLVRDRIELGELAPWLTIVAGSAGSEHVLLSDGWHHVRLDVAEGQLKGRDAVWLQYRIDGLTTAGEQILPLRRFLALCRLRRFPSALFPRDPRIARGIDMLRVHDALDEGAIQREIAAALFGEQRVADEWGGASDSLRSRVRRLAGDARAMARGGYRFLLRPAR